MCNSYIASYVATASYVVLASCVAIAMCSSYIAMCIVCNINTKDTNLSESLEISNMLAKLEQAKANNETSANNSLHPYFVRKYIVER